MTDPTLLPSWRGLEAEAEALRGSHLKDLFARDPDRVAAMHLHGADLLIDFSKQRLSRRALELLRSLAAERGVGAQIASLFAGDMVNTTERRPALHMALRAAPGDVFRHEGRDVVPEVLAERRRLGEFCRELHAGRWRGVSGAPISDVINIGIGGSDLGPRMAAQALCAHARPGVRVHFVSNVDGADLGSLLPRLAPETTLLVVVSKTFSTQETMANARSALAWLEAKHPGAPRAALLERHCIALTAKPAAAAAFGVPPANCFAFWDWVGGRYSLWSSVGLGIALAAGVEAFEQMQGGAREMDAHFRDAPPAQNLPLTLALIDVWNGNFLGAQTHAIVPYSASLRLLPAYLQQLEMESNGKAVDRAGAPLALTASPIVWGSAGTDAQHSYFQLLHQGRRLVPIDFIAVANADFPLGEHHAMLLANCFAQSEALMRGRDAAEARAEMEAAGRSPEEIAHLLPHRVFPGNQPSTTLLAPSLSPRTLGALIALYEHKVFAAAAIWGLNPFDQFGVELGKAMADALLPALATGAQPQMSASTRLLIAYCRDKAAPKR